MKDYMKICYIDQDSADYLGCEYSTDFGEHTLITCGERTMIAMMGGYIEIYKDKNTAKARYEQIKDSFPSVNVSLDGHAVVYGVEQFINDAIGK